VTSQPATGGPHGAAPGPGEQPGQAGRAGRGGERDAGRAADMLAAACAALRPADAADAVAGVQPRWVAAPTSVAEAAATMRAAAELDLAVVPRGSGSRLSWGLPPRRCDLVIDTSGLDEVIEHAAGDWVATVQAGVRLDQLGAVLGEAGQRLSLDLPGASGGHAPAPRAVPPQTVAPQTVAPQAQAPQTVAPQAQAPQTVAPQTMAPQAQAPQAQAPQTVAPQAQAPQAVGTVGGMLATGMAGPQRLRYGRPRDLLTGMTVVRADGLVARSGGKVVKNVAGYDLGKLFAGSYGTLGLIVEATFRLHPVPAAVAYITLECPGAAGAAAAVAAAAESQLQATGVEIDRPVPGGPVQVGVLLEGSNRDGVPVRVDGLLGLLGEDAVAHGEAPVWWGRSSTAPAGGTLIRVAFWPGALRAILDAVDAAATAAGLAPALGGSAAAGVLYAAVDGQANAAAVASFVTMLRAAAGRAPAAGFPPARGSVVVLTAPAAVRGALDMWGPVPDAALIRAVKDQFDPGHRMAPGRFAGGV
jgi:glycolate oxidase FAD binding subunit